MSRSECEHHFVQANGLRFHVVQAGPQDGARVLLLHGFPEFWRAWEPQIEALARAGHRVWAPDLRGYGETEKPGGIEAYGLETLADDVCALIDAMGGDRIVLVGHDWGGALSWRVAMRNPEKVRRLAVLSAPHPAVMRERMRQGRQRLRSWYMHFFRLPRLPEWLLGRRDGQALARSLQRGRQAFTPDDLAHYRAAWRRPGAMTAMLNWYRALMRDLPGVQAECVVEMPLLLLWGEHDHALGIEMAAPSVAYCKRGQLVRVDAGHWLMREAAAEVNARLLSFCEADGS